MKQLPSRRLAAQIFYHNTMKITKQQVAIQVEQSVQQQTLDHMRKQVYRFYRLQLLGQQQFEGWVEEEIT